MTRILIFPHAFRSALFLLISFVAIACSDKNSASRIQSPQISDALPGRFVGVWEVSKAELVSDNYSFMVKSFEKQEGLLTALSRVEVERILRNHIEGFMDVKTSLEINADGTSSLIYKEEGKANAKEPFEWSYKKGEIFFNDFTEESFMVYELTGQLIRELEIPLFSEGKLKVRYTKIK